MRKIENRYLGLVVAFCMCAGLSAKTENDSLPMAPDTWERSPQEFFAQDVKVYENLSPYFEMPDLAVPQFPDHDFVITDYGAIGDGETLNTSAIKEAIAACFEAGGGRVIIPKGEWLTGAFHMKSNVNLHIVEGAVLKFSQRYEDYLPVVFTRWEGTECYNYCPPIYANGVQNIAITGKGTIDGQGEFWWPWKWSIHKEKAIQLYQMAVDGYPPSERIFGNKIPGLRPNFVQFISCKGVLVENVTLKNGPMWTIHPVYCSDVIVRGVKVITEGPNNDGLNPDSCRNVLIEDCYFSTGDDCVAINAGINEDGWRVGRPSENIVVRNIFSHEGHGGVVCGSAMSGSIRNVYAHHNTFVGTDRGLRIKSMRGRGGVLENVWFENNWMKDIPNEAIRLNMFYEYTTVNPTTQEPSVFRNIMIRNNYCDGAKRAVEIKGLPEQPIENVVLENLVIKSSSGIRVKDATGLVISKVSLETSSGMPLELDEVFGAQISEIMFASPTKP